MLETFHYDTVSPLLTIDILNVYRPLCNVRNFKPPLGLLFKFSAVLYFGLRDVQTCSTPHFYENDAVRAFCVNTIELVKVWV
jgi:hypothetical protein